MSKRTPTFFEIIEKINKENARKERIRIKEEIKQIQLENEEKVNEINYKIESLTNNMENIIKNTRLTDFDYEHYYKSMEYPLIIDDYIPLEFPNEKMLRKKIGCKKERKIIEKIFKKRKEVRITKGAQFESEWEELVKDYERNEKENKKKYEEYKNTQISINNEMNKSIYDRKKNFLNCDEDEVSSIFKFLYENYNQPSGGGITYVNFSYNGKQKNATIALQFINPETELIEIKKFKYLKTKNECKEIYFTNNERECLYEQIVFNSMTSFAATILYSLYKVIDTIIINAYVNKTNTASGNNENYYFVSVILNKDDIPYNNLDKIDGKSFLDSKNAKYVLPLMKTKRIISYSFDKENLIDSINNNISGIDFEKVSKQLLEKNGFDNVNVTKASGDYGADVIAYKDGIKYAIQCKKYSSKVGVNAVQEVIAAKSMYKCHVGVVLTNNYFTPNAKKLAEENGVLLWDIEKLQQLISNSGLDGQSKIKKLITIILMKRIMTT